VVRAAPEIARVAAVSAFNVFSWGIGASIAGVNYVTRRAMDGEPATAIAHDAATTCAARPCAPWVCRSTADRTSPSG